MVDKIKIEEVKEIQSENPGGIFKKIILSIEKKLNNNDSLKINYELLDSELKIKNIKQIKE